MMRVVALSGGIGGAKLALGLYKALAPSELTVIVNTGDDIELHGLRISPDVDTVMYTLVGLVDPGKGWGMKDDSFRCLQSLHDGYHQETWFNLGDRDLSTHILRTKMLRDGRVLSEVTRKLCDLIGLEDVGILPMTDDMVTSHVRIGDGSSIHFEEYFVKRGCKDKILGIEYVGSEKARAAAGVTEAIDDADAIIICPSNPIASIGPILSIPSIAAAVRGARCPVIAVSPLVGGRAVKGPTEDFMNALGMEVSARGIGEYYRDTVTHLVIDTADAQSAPTVKSLGLRVLVTNTLMHSLDDKIRLAQDVLALVP